MVVTELDKITTIVDNKNFKRINSLANVQGFTWGDDKYFFQFNKSWKGLLAILFNKKHCKQYLD